MDLPGHGGERGEVVLAVGKHPRQAVTATDVTRYSYAKWAVSIVQGNLGDGSEQVLACGFKSSDRGDQQRRDARAKQISDPPFGGGETEPPIRRGDQASGEADPFGLIAIK